MTIKPNKQNLGTLRVSQPHTTFTTIVNDSSEDITVQLKNGCGSCTQSELQNGGNLIKANSSETMKVVFTPKSTGANVIKIVTVIPFKDGIEVTGGRQIFTFSAQVTN